MANKSNICEYYILVLNINRTSIPQHLTFNIYYVIIASAHSKYNCEKIKMSNTIHA